MKKQADEKAPARFGVIQLAKLYYHCLKGCLNRQVPHSGLQFDLEFAFLRVEDIKDALSESIGTRITGDTLLTWLRFFALGCSNEQATEEKRLIDTFRLLIELVQSRSNPGFRFWADTEFLIVDEEHDGPIVPDLFSKTPVRASNIDTMSRDELKILKGINLERSYLKRNRVTKSATPEHSKISLNLNSDEKSQLDSLLIKTQSKTDGFSVSRIRHSSAKKQPLLDLGYLPHSILSSKTDKILASYDTTGAITTSEYKGCSSPLRKEDYAYLASKPPRDRLDVQLSSRRLNKIDILFRPSECQDSALNKAIRKLREAKNICADDMKKLPNEDIKSYLQIRRREQINRQLDTLRDQHTKSQRKYKVVTNYISKASNGSRINLSQVLKKKAEIESIKPNNSNIIYPDCNDSTYSGITRLHPKMIDSKVSEKLRNFFNPGQSGK
jgi:hypothetical protein